MTLWHRACRRRSRLLLQAACSRPYSAARPERVEVRCGSGGHVAIDLFNMRNAWSMNDPLLVHLPPFPSQNNTTPQLPVFLRGWPVVSINYRWSPYSESTADVDDATPLHWPIPVHDTSFAMAWLLRNLSPPEESRRDIYVYGSYLGASLATSLALTETYPQARFSVRGLIAYNGIYNWTMFLPGHGINEAPKRRKMTTLPPEPVNGSHIHELRKNMPALFRSASNLFDPFASPSLFFHSPDVTVPESFFITAEYAALINNMMSDEEIDPTPTKVPRKSHLLFPPRDSTLKIPETLIVYESAPSPPSVGSESASKPNTTRRRTSSAGNCFQSQATELVELMRRSVDMEESTERSKWDEDMDSWAEEVTRRVQIVDAGPETGSIQPSDAACDAISCWIEDTF